MRSRAVKPPHDDVFCIGDGGGAGAAGFAISGHASAGSCGEMALDLNYDMLLPIGIPRSVNLGGAERIDFWPTVEQGGKGVRPEIVARSRADGAGHYYRSDHFSLARVGIPAFSVDQGELFEGHDLKHGATRRWRTTWRITITSRPMSIAPTGISVGNAKLARFGFRPGLAGERAGEAD